MTVPSDTVAGTFRTRVWEARRTLLVVAGLCAMLAAAWMAGRAAERWTLADLRRSAASTLSLQVGVLRAEMQKQTSLPLALATDPEIAAVLRPEADPALAAQVNGRLAQVATATGSAVIYVIGVDGITRAASNAAEDRSFVGRDYSFRPYFRQALATGAGSQFALGTVSGRPGLYLARRLSDASGVVVVKVEFDAVEAAWRAAGENVFVADPRGIVLIASDPAWRFSALRAVDGDERKRIRETLEFGEAPLEVLPLHRPGGDGAPVRVGRGALPAWPALLLDTAVPDTDWRLYALTPVKAALERERIQAWIIAALVCGLGWLGIATLAGRGRRTRVRLAEAAARREELETSVRERTRALSEANRQLRAEMEERRRAEDERERLGRELAQAGRRAALGQFAASMAHEINQPLAAIRSYADNTAILVRRGRVEDAAENAFAIGRLTDRIGALTRQLKGFAQRASGRREPVLLATVFRNSLEVVQVRAAGAGTRLDAAAPAPGLAVLGDGARLEQTLINLLQNALDAVAGRAEAHVTLVLEETDLRVAVEVRDNGPGIAQDAFAKIFDPFFTTKSDGLGLGLAIARGIVEECGGTLSVCSGPEGTVFRMELARAAPDGAVTGSMEATA